MHEKIGSWLLIVTKSHDQEKCVKKSVPHLTCPSSLYTIRGDQCMKKLALGH
jgi:hypothetical protein